MVVWVENDTILKINVHSSLRAKTLSSAYLIKLGLKGGDARVQLLSPDKQIPYL